MLTFPQFAFCETFLQPLNLEIQSLDLSVLKTNLYALVLMTSLLGSPTSELLRVFVHLRVPFTTIVSFLFGLDKDSLSLPKPISTASDLYVIVIIGQYLTNSDHVLDSFVNVLHLPLSYPPANDQLSSLFLSLINCAQLPVPPLFHP